jgi:hypothetical protein
MGLSIRDDLLSFEWYLEILELLSGWKQEEHIQFEFSSERKFEDTDADQQINGNRWPIAQGLAEAWGIAF